MPAHHSLSNLTCKASIALLAGFLAFTGSQALAEDFHFAGTTDPQTMDPHAVNTAPVLGFLNNIYEGLVRRDKNMAIEGALAESWEPIGNKGWRFNLRKGVTFHDGSEFTADDVLFSYERANSEDSDVRAWFAPVDRVVVVDDHTVDFLTKAPNPIFPDSIANFMIMDRGWAEANDTLTPSRETETFATLNTNGTGAFRVTDREPGIQTILQPFDNWWGKPEHNITKAIFSPITSEATAVAALLSGEVDFINPVPVQDVPRLESTDGLKVHEGIEARVMMLGFPHQAEALVFSNDVTETNPFADVRVRKAIYHAIDVDALIRAIMRGNAEPASQLVSSTMRGYTESLADRFDHDPDLAKQLLIEAGYPNGFSFGMVCPNDRYINDESICQAIAGMLAKIDLDVELMTMPVRNYWPELRGDKFDLYLLGWSPGTFDAEHPIRFLAATPNDETNLGTWNFGGFSNERVDALLPKIQSEIDDAKRTEMLDEVHKILQDEVAYVPMYVQPLIWASKDNIDLTQRADNFFILRWVTIN